MVVLCLQNTGGTKRPSSVLSSRYLCQFNADGRNFNDVITSARYAPAMILLAYNLEQGVGCGDQVQRAACFCFCICTSLYLLLLLLYMHKSLFVRARARGVLHFTTKAL